jgi:hypothetical protein
VRDDDRNLDWVLRRHAALDAHVEALPVDRGHDVVEEIVVGGHGHAERRSDRNVRDDPGLDPQSLERSGCAAFRHARSRSLLGGDVDRRAAPRHRKQDADHDAQQPQPVHVPHSHAC